MKNSTKTTTISRGALARRTGSHIETIRYYEKIGLLPEPLRSSGGHRLYRSDDQRRLRFILRSRELGFSIDEIRSLLSMTDKDDYTCGEIQVLTVAHLESIRQKLTDLKRLERTLARISNQCEGGDVPDCPVIDALWAS